MRPPPEIRPPWRLRLRRLRMALATALGSPQGFFIPYRYAAAVPPPGRRAPYAALADLFARREVAFGEFVGAIDALAADLRRIGTDPPPAPRWRQAWFPRLDAAAAYAMVRTRAPGRIVEVGSGHSTRFFARAVADGGHQTALVAIDPAPRAAISGLGVQIVEKAVQAAGTAPFDALVAGDVLSIDSSHILMPGSDVDFLLNVVLPRLPSGVLVHVHDIFLPDDYPPQWAWRAYNEQLGVGVLAVGGGYEILWSSRYVATRMADVLAGTVVAELEAMPDTVESSLWLLKR